jgi:hypothetical protein
MDEQAQQVLNYLRDAELLAKQLANDMARENRPGWKIERINLAIDSIGAAQRLIENAKY